MFVIICKQVLSNLELQITSTYTVLGYATNSHKAICVSYQPKISNYIIGIIPIKRNCYNKIKQIC